MPGDDDDILRARQLPSGRHGLTREFVMANQRERILDAVALIARQGGYWSMSLDNIAAASGTSRRTFYTLFDTKEDAFLAACDSIAERLLQTAYAVYDPSDPLVERGHRCLEAVIGFLCDHPDHAHVIIVQVLTAGPQAVKRRDNALQLLADLVEQATSELSESVRPPSTTAEAVVGGIYQVLYRRILAGRIEELPELLPQLLFMLLVPYIGHERATAARDAAATPAGRP